MTVQSHIDTLKQKHSNLENQLRQAIQHPSTDNLDIADIKRQKLIIKDQIARLEENTVH